MKLTKQFWLSIIFGIAGLGLSLLRFNVVLENFRISLHWGFVPPLIIAIAYGPKYGLISGILGLGAFFPFLLWPENGYANLLAFFCIYHRTFVLVILQKSERKS